MTLPAVQPASLLRTGMRFGLFTAAAVVGYAVLVAVVLRPLHAAGWCQPALGYFNGVAAILQYPGVQAFRVGHARLGYPALPAVWLISLALTATFYFVAGALLRLFWG